MTPPPTRIPAALLALALALALIPLAAPATSICRWVDESGRTQMSDVVPERYKNSATCSDSKQYELSPQQKHEVEKRDIEAQSRKRLEMADSPAKTASSPGGNGVSAPQPGAKSVKRPVDVITDSTDCATRWRIYDESVECFGPYRTTRGATKPEGFEMCNEIPSPEVVCGPRRD